MSLIEDSKRVNIRRTVYTVLEKTFKTKLQADIESKIAINKFDENKIDTDVFIQQIKEMTGIDITLKNREQDVIFTKAIYCKILRDQTKYSLDKIAKPLGLKHCSVLHLLNNVFPDTLKSKPHRKLYYDLINITDPNTLRKDNNDVDISKKLLEEILKDCGFWLKPNNKRQIEKLLEI